MRTCSNQAFYDYSPNIVCELVFEIKARTTMGVRVIHRRARLYTENGRRYGETEFFGDV